LNEKLREFVDWDKYYREEDVESMPWYHEGLDEDFEAAIRRIGITSGRVLDIGTGPGTQAIALAERGFSVTATDVSEAAVEGARQRAAEKGVDIEFFCEDILSSRLHGGFDLVIDRGCFHVLAPDMRPAYVTTVLGLIKPGGYLLLKCFSHLETDMQGGPYRFSPEQIRALFFNHFEILSIEDSIFHGTLENRPRALFSVMLRA